MKKYHIYHNTNGIADQYFVVENVTGFVKFQLPRWLGRILNRRKN